MTAKPLSAYQKKLLDPRWQRKRLEILERDKWTCRICRNTTETLHVHHLEYRSGADPWVYPNESMETVCEKCHRVCHAPFENGVTVLGQVLLEAGFSNRDLLILIRAFDHPAELRRYSTFSTVKMLGFLLTHPKEQLALYRRWKKWSRQAVVATGG